MKPNALDSIADEVWTDLSKYFGYPDHFSYSYIDWKDGEHKYTDDFKALLLFYSLNRSTAPSDMHFMDFVALTKRRWAYSAKSIIDQQFKLSPLLQPFMDLPGHFKEFYSIFHFVVFRAIGKHLPDKEKPVVRESVDLSKFPIEERLDSDLYLTVLPHGYATSTDGADWQYVKFTSKYR